MVTWTANGWNITFGGTISLHIVKRVFLWCITLLSGSAVRLFPYEPWLLLIFLAATTWTICAKFVRDGDTLTWNKSSPAGLHLSRWRMCLFPSRLVSGHSTQKMPADANCALMDSIAIASPRIHTVTKCEQPLSYTRPPPEDHFLCTKRCSTSWSEQSLHSLESYLNKAGIITAWTYTLSLFSLDMLKDSAIWKGSFSSLLLIQCVLFVGITGLISARSGPALQVNCPEITLLRNRCYTNKVDFLLSFSPPL